tara:strand:+ start:1298 stop:6019 length:4722 start_codon:yes stop_codon:yes gene_type:complete
MTDSDKGKTQQKVSDAVKKLFDDARKKLVETGTRNRLIHVNRANARGNVVNIVNEESDAVFQILSTRKAMRFKALGKDNEEKLDESIRFSEIHDESGGYESIHDNFLETRLGPDGLQKRLLKIAKDAQIAEEEQGVNILYLALGFIAWYEDTNSTVKREAPLLLLPVELVRNSRTSTYDIRLRDDEIITNLPLQKRLREDFGIEIPDIEIEDDWAPSAYFQKFEPIISSKSRWNIDQNGIQLGFFSFSKLLMFLDLAVDAWPDNALVNHPLTRGLLYEGFRSEGSIFNDDEKLDEILPPSKMFHVVDADASQAQVIEEVRSGLNLVVQGPPGTGKSQTITNIIAAAVKEGKTVLFVAEKMAALSVVHSRLVKVGLSDTCLELHSRSANKKAVVQELGRTLNATQAIPKIPESPAQLLDSRDRLNDLSEAIHTPLGKTGETAFSVLARQVRFIGKKATPPIIHADALVSISRADEKQLSSVIEQYAELLRSYVRIQDHPFSGVRKLNLQPVDLSRIARKLLEANRLLASSSSAFDSLHKTLELDKSCCIAVAEQVETLLDVLSEIPTENAKESLLISGCPDIARIIESLEYGLDWRSNLEVASKSFKEGAFNEPISALRPALLAGTISFFSRWGSKYRNASKQLSSWLVVPLPKRADERVRLVDDISNVATSKLNLEQDQNFCAKYLEDYWRGDRTDFDRLLEVSKWCLRLISLKLDIDIDKAISLAVDESKLDAFRNSTKGLLNETFHSVESIFDSIDLDPRVFGKDSLRDVPLNELIPCFARMEENIDRYNEWSQIQRYKKALIEAGLSELDSLIESGKLSGPDAVTEFRFSRAEKLWKLALETIPALEGVDGINRHILVEKFSSLERSRLKDNVASILAGHLSRVPTGALGEMGVVRGEIGKKKRHFPIRKLFKNAPNAIQRIKPVLLMSPISVAQFLPPGVVTFDLLVIDEASQVRPEDSLGAIARANQIVVVGDQKQLPPSSFFERLLDDEDSEDSDDETDPEQNLLGGAPKAGEMESILTLCEARGLNARMLKWHYRSRDPSLIRVSNQEFYRNGLILPPSPLQDDPAYGLSFTRVGGVYDRGGKRDNRIEGEAIVARIARHARTRPDMSLGVVTFSSAQRNLITELLEFGRRTDSVLDSFLREGKAEDVFVKNIENVQGDERDVIIVSVCYGPTVAGARLSSMAFGPVNAEGGERRLNVLFTRARISCEVFASFDPGDIDPARVKREGPRVLKRFLDFAKSGVIDEAVPTGEDFDSPFEEDVSDVIIGMGYLADPQVGSSGFKIDLGVRHPDSPGTYILAVECDGATYHSALWARERDRLRQDVLEHLGWQFHRIWSTDWFYNRQAEIDRLRLALEAARLKASSGIEVEGANLASLLGSNETIDTPEFQVVEIEQVKMPPYARAKFSIRSRYEPHETPIHTLAIELIKIIDIEGPIHADEAARRLASCFGKEKAGSRILKATKNALTHAKSMNSELLEKDSFWMMKSQLESPKIRSREAETGTILKAEYISAVEINAALEFSRNQNAGGVDEEIFRSAAQLLGFKKLGPDLKLRFTDVLVTSEKYLD